MIQYKATRKSHCGICGKRLSETAAPGMIRWLPSRVDDAGIYCASCKPSGKKQQ